MTRWMLWDFDGVILDSNEVRERGFREIFADHDEARVEALLAYHRANGGLSRYVKIRYFFERIVGRPTSDAEVEALAERFSAIMREALIDPANLIEDAVGFIRRAHGVMPLFIVSGSDQRELRYLCERLGVSRYFDEILGSPTPKTENVRALIAARGIDPRRAALIGDSQNDLDAARDNDLVFLGYNNPALEAVSDRYLRSLSAEDPEALW